MKKNIVIAMSAVLLLGSCDTSTGAGAYMGASLGSILGSAIGGIVGGPRGSDIGTIVGAAATGSAEDDARQQQHEYLAQRNLRIQASKRQQNHTHTECDDTYNAPMRQRLNGSDSYTYGQPQSGNEGGDGYRIDPTQMIDESNSGDDRIDFTTDTDSTATEPAADYDATISQVGQSAASSQKKIELRKVVFTDNNNDGVLRAGETGTVVFELYNRSGSTIYNVVPTVQAENQSRYIYISPSIRVESIDPGHGIRYTATVKADRKIKDGSVKLYVSATQNGKPVSYTTVVDVPTRRK